MRYKMSARRVKRLYIIVMSMMILWMGFTFAADFEAGVTPDTQSAISGTIVSFDVVVSNNTGFDSVFILSLPSQLNYTNASITPDNNQSLIWGAEHNPYWTLSVGQTRSVHIEAEINVLSFDMLDVLSNIVDVDNFSNIYTSAVANIDSISDVVVTKVLVGDEPQLTGDIVTYNILIENIGSAIATGIDFVDVWPDTILTLLNQSLVNGVATIPMIYNSLANNYLFAISDLIPGASSMVQMIGSMDAMFPGGQAFTNEAFVLIESEQYSELNDNDAIINHVRGIADVYVTKSQTSSNPAAIGNEVTYLISYGNNGDTIATGVVVNDMLPNVLSFVSASSNPMNQVGNNISWNIGSLNPGQNGQITVVGSFLGGVAIGSIFTNSVQISTTDFELNYTNNNDSATGTVLEFTDMSVSLYANNLTDPSRNTNTGTQILAVSGDVVELQIVITNDGNVLETGTVSIANINGFVNYVGPISWDLNLAAGDSQTITVSGRVGPQGYISFTPIATISYDNLSETDDVVINEPLACGDGLITQNEVCDTNGQIGNFLLGQHCEEQNGQCVLVTENITNTVCMQYTTDIGTGEQCMSVVVNYDEPDLDMGCELLSAPYGTVIVGEDLEGDMDFTCTSTDNLIADEIRIDCGNGDIGVAHATASFTYNCEYQYDENGDLEDNLYDVQCYVEDNTCEACHNAVRVDEGFYGICGDGTMDDGEECDLGGEEDEEIDIDRYLDLDRDYRAGRYEDAGYYCEDCRIREADDTFVYQPPQCLGTNTTISVMDNELMPFRWRLRERDNMRLRDNYDCADVDNDEIRTIIDKDSMKCTFAVYNGVDYLQADNDEVNKFTVDCFEQEDSMFFDYFEEEYQVDFDKISGKYVRSVNSLLDGNVDTYGEHKLVLEKVEYEYCDPDTQEWEEGRLYEGICEVNFAVTRPYMMQVSTFGFDPVATDDSDFLIDFYDMKGNALVKSTDIEDTMDVDERDYEFDSSVSEQMLGFKNKYEALSIEINNSFEVRDGRTVGELFGVDTVVKKVPNQLIFFVKGEGELVLKQLTEYFPGTPFTLYIEGMDVVVEGSVKTNGMIITDQKISFEDDSSQNYCEEGGQIVQGIFVAQGGFESNERLRNADENDERCPRGNLQVQGVLIGSDLESLMNNKRSHLNDWFEVSSNSESAIKRERKNEIFEGAALLIEYNPDLWSSLPPGAESFTQTLDVYRK